MILYVQNHKDYTDHPQKNLLEVIKKLYKSVEYKINTQNSVAYPLTINEQYENEIKKITLFIKKNPQ